MEIFLLALRMLYDTFIIAFFPACTLPAAGSLFPKEKSTGEKPVDRKGLYAQYKGLIQPLEII